MPTAHSVAAPGNVDAASALIGPVVFRRLLLHEAPSNERVSAFIDMTLQGIAASRVEDPNR